MVSVEKLTMNVNFQELVAEVQQQLDSRQPQADRRPALQARRQELDSQIDGWGLSLGNPNLASRTRSRLEEQMETAEAELQAVEQELIVAESEASRVRLNVDPADVADCLNRLAELLGSEHASATNLELARHLDKIQCFPEGRYVVRSFKLGAFAPNLGRTVHQLRSMGGSAAPPAEESGNGYRIQPRKRGRLEVDCDFRETLEHNRHMDLAMSPDRFQGLGQEWFWEDEFQLQIKRSWPEIHAEEVYRYRTETTPRPTWVAMEKHFKKTTPTLRKAYKLYQQSLQEKGAES